MAAPFTTTWQALVKISQIEQKPFYYIESESHYQLFLLVGLTFYAELDKQDDDAKTFETSYKSEAIKLN